MTLGVVIMRQGFGEKNSVIVNNQNGAHSEARRQDVYILNVSIGNSFGILTKLGLITVQSPIF